MISLPTYQIHVKLESLGGAAALPVSGRDPVMSGKGHGAASMEGKGPRSEILRGGNRSDPPFKAAYTFMLEPRLQLMPNCKNEYPQGSSMPPCPLCRPCPPRLRKLHEGLPECQRPSVRCTCRCFHAFSGCWQAKVTFFRGFRQRALRSKSICFSAYFTGSSQILSPKQNTLNSTTRNETLNLVLGPF